jgi:hypothetical protein
MDGDLDGWTFIRSIAERRSEEELELLVGPVGDPNGQNRVWVAGLADVIRPVLKCDESCGCDLGDGNLNAVCMLVRLVERNCLRSRRCVRSVACRSFLAGLGDWLVDTASKEQQHGTENHDPAWRRHGLRPAARALRYPA